MLDREIFAHVERIVAAHENAVGSERHDEELERAQRAAATLSLLVADLDGLKELNDRFGHAAGDAARELGEGGEEGRDNDIVRETFERTGASVMGKRMFDAGAEPWGEDPPFRTPVFVVTFDSVEVTYAAMLADGFDIALPTAEEVDPGSPEA